MCVPAVRCSYRSRSTHLNEECPSTQLLVHWLFLVNRVPPRGKTQIVLTLYCLEDVMKITLQMTVIPLINIYNSMIR